MCCVVAVSGSFREEKCLVNTTHRFTPAYRVVHQVRSDALGTTAPLLAVKQLTYLRRKPPHHNLLFEGRVSKSLFGFFGTTLVKPSTSFSGCLSFSRVFASCPYSSGHCHASLVSVVLAVAAASCCFQAPSSREFFDLLLHTLLLICVLRSAFPCSPCYFGHLQLWPLQSWSMFSERFFSISSLSASDPLSLSFPFRTICPQKSTRSLLPDPSPRLVVSFFEASERSPLPHHTEPLGHHCPSLFFV